MNKFELDVPYSDFVFPCNLCTNKTSEIQYCKGCKFYLAQDIYLEKAKQDVQNVFDNFMTPKQVDYLEEACYFDVEALKNLSERHKKMPEHYANRLHCISTKEEE